LSLDSKSANKLATDQDGNYYSVGVGGAIIGRGANLFLIDDPIKNRQEAESDAARRKIWDWYRGVAYTRLMPKNAVIVVMTRWHFDDLAGRLLEEMEHENWTILNLAAECDTEDDLLGRQVGEALSTRYPIKTLHQIRMTVGTREWNAQYQQRPLPAEGGLINIEWFQKYNYADWLAVVAAVRLGVKKPPNKFDITQIVISWDTAFKESQLNDPSAGTVWLKTKDNNFYLVDVINKRMRYPILKKRVIAEWEKYMEYGFGHVPVLIEDKASGQSLIQDLKMGTAIPVIARPADANKQIRLSSATPLIEGGRVFLPDQSPWVVEYETQHIRFPFWKFDDLVDSTSQFLNWVGKPHYKRSKKKRFWK
jgi:predicted phage terminase large subunit-like protein